MPDNLVAVSSGPSAGAGLGRVCVVHRASATGVVMVAGQKISLGRVHAGDTVTIDGTDTELVVHCDDNPRTLRTTDRPVHNIKADRPRKPVQATPAGSTPRHSTQSRPG
jgi:hypothetical protein